ncbi:glutathione S-transferase family protein [Paraburkholderia sp. LEh10]|uniref:glutathione S-transferase family protein n=1 Tax=Paraburkholderia sp. LEh10 TaxID=2821353 RepID=UPI001AEB861F|nr:glutathione S-transferase family protein [Paraburkholderia sp. LEh10]MBP0590439.1 glutathione S-transferase family protein [Paraburkholderia sp. LEh10]
MILYDGNAPGPNPVSVRLFIFERCGIKLDVESVDLRNLANRSRRYRTTVNSRGEVPALKLDDGRIITEITAICGYLDEVAKGGKRLFGETPEERAEIAMWVRRVDLEVCQPFVTWWRGTDAGENLYRGNRVLFPEAKTNNRLLAEKGLNQLDDDMERRAFVAGDRITMADILLYGFMGAMNQMIPSLNPPGRTKVAAWFLRMAGREAAKKIMTDLPSKIEN